MVFTQQQLQEYTKSPDRLRLLNKDSLIAALSGYVNLKNTKDYYYYREKFGYYQTPKYFQCQETLLQNLVREQKLTLDLLFNIILPTLTSPNLNLLIKDCVSNYDEHIIITIAEFLPSLLIPLFNTIGLEAALYLINQNYLTDYYLHEGSRIYFNNHSVLKRKYSSVLDCLAKTNPTIFLDILKWLKNKDSSIDLSKVLMQKNGDSHSAKYVIQIMPMTMTSLLAFTPDTCEALLTQVNTQTLKIDDIPFLAHYFMGLNEAKTLSRERVLQESATQQDSYSIGALQGRINKIQDKFFSDCAKLYFDFLEESVNKKDKELESKGAKELLAGLISASYESTEEKRIKVLVEIIQRRTTRIQNTSRDMAAQPEKATNRLYKNLETQIKKGYPTLFSPKLLDSTLETFDGNNPWIKLHRYLHVIFTCDSQYYAMLEPWFISLHAKHVNNKKIDATIIGADRPPKKNVLDQSWRNPEREKLLELTVACISCGSGAHTGYQKFLTGIGSENTLAIKIAENYPSTNEAGSSSSYRA